MQKKHTVYKIISGGQTGADKAALIAAKALNLETGGWCIKNFQTEEGPNLELQDYGLKCLNTESYPVRTKKNVDDSDGTVVFRLKYSVGSDKTIGYAQFGIWKNGEIKTMNKKESRYKPVCVISNITDEEKCTQHILKFITDNDIKILNVAGHRESSAPMKDFSLIVERIMYNVLK